MKQLEMLYEGKAKQVFRTDDPEKIIIHYKDAATAFNNIKKATIENKGVLNNAISTLIFKELHKAGVKTHYIETINDRDQVCRRVTIIPLEVIVDDFTEPVRDPGKLSNFYHPSDHRPILVDFDMK